MSRSRILLLVLLHTANVKAFAQYSWFLDFKGSNYVGAEDLSVDQNDDVFVVGNFGDGVMIHGSSYTGKGAFLLKLSENGIPQWHKIIRYSDDDFSALYHVETDGEGNVYIGGSFPAAASIDGSELFTSSFAFNTMLAKLSPDGVILWTKVIPNVQEIYDMKVNDAGSILLYTHHYGTVTFDNVNLNVGPNSFGMLLSSQGDVVWAKTIGNPAQYTTWPKACALDISGNAYFHGLFSGTLTLDGKQAMSTGGNYDYFFTRINSQGICQWLNAAERKAPVVYQNPNPPSGLVIERGALEVDDQGNVYAGGTYWQGMTIGNIQLAPQFTGELDNHLFLIKFNNAGMLEWAKAPALTTSNNTVDDIIVRNGRVYFAGIRFSEFYFSVYSPTGNAIEDAIMIPLNGDIASGFGIDSKDSVYMSGRMYNPSANLDGFVFKYKNNIATPPHDAGVINEPTAFCAWENTVTIATASIEGAHTYEWEVLHNGQSTLFATAVPELELSVIDLSLIDDFEVRVRGANDFGKGNYSPTHVVRIENGLENPVLFSTCKKIYMEEDGPNIMWYYNDQLLDQHAGEVSIVPESEGTYYVTISNSCGSFVSNIISFDPLISDLVFIPNIITPNGDEDNQFFVVDEVLQSPALTVFNRWGNLVYYSSQYSNTWNGGDLSNGLYYYKLTSECFNNPIQGSLTIRK